MTVSTIKPVKPGTPPRRGNSKYNPTPAETVRALIAYHDAAVAHLRDPEANPAPNPADLLIGLPQSSITAAELHDWPEGPVVGFRIGERNPRFVTPAGFLILRAVSLFGGAPFIDTNLSENEKHYVEVLANGFTLQRLMAGAEPGEVLRLIADHHNLCPWALAIEPGGRAVRDRRGAINAALKRYDTNAAAWGLTGELSKAGFEALLRGSFRLFDSLHGHHLLRPVRSSKAA